MFTAEWLSGADLMALCLLLAVFDDGISSCLTVTPMDNRLGTPTTLGRRAGVGIFDDDNDVFTVTGCCCVF